MKPLRCIALLLLSACLIGCTQQAPTETITVDKEGVAAAIANIWADYLVAWKNGDAETCVSYLTPEGYINMPSYAQTTDFLETSEMFISVFQNNIIDRADYEQLEVFVHEDMAYEFGLLDQQWIDRSSGDTTAFKNRFVSVWKKMEDDSWKLYRWMAQD